MILICKLIDIWNNRNKSKKIHPRDNLMNTHYDEKTIKYISLQTSYKKPGVLFNYVYDNDY